MMDQRYVSVDDGDGNYMVGEIIDQPVPGYYLVRLEPASEMRGAGVGPTHLFFVGEMICVDESGLKNWTFFKTAEERRAWIDWLRSPLTTETKKVVRLVGDQE